MNYKSADLQRVFPLYFKQSFNVFHQAIVSGKGRVPNSSRKSLIPTLVVASDPLVVPLRKLRRECSRSGPADGMTPIDDIHEL